MEVDDCLLSIHSAKFQRDALWCYFALGTSDEVRGARVDMRM